MKKLTLITCFLLLGGTLLASPTTLTDPYAGANPGNADGSGFYGDVIGKLKLFDIEKLVFNKIEDDEVDLDIFVNYNNGDESLSPFYVGGDRLVPGDLLFGQAGQYLFGVPIRSHGFVTAGNLYGITDTLTAYEVLLRGNYDSTTYRPKEDVWINSAATKTLLGTGSVAAYDYDHSEIRIHVNFDPDATFMAAYAQGLEVQWASAVCGNDILGGMVMPSDDPGVPEPATYTLLGAGLLAFALIGRRKFSNR